MEFLSKLNRTFAKAYLLHSDEDKVTYYHRAIYRIEDRYRSLVPVPTLVRLFHQFESEFTHQSREVEIEKKSLKMIEGSNTKCSVEYID